MNRNFIMDIWILELLGTITQTCDQYLEKKISLPALQDAVSATSENFDNTVPKELRRKIHNFVEELEHIRFMYNDYEQFDIVANKINDLNSILSTYMN